MILFHWLLFRSFTVLAHTNRISNNLCIVYVTNNSSFLLSVCLESICCVFFNFFQYIPIQHSLNIAWFSHCHPWRTSASISIKFHHKTCHRFDLRPPLWKPLPARYSRNIQKAYWRTVFFETTASVGRDLKESRRWQ